MLNEVPRAAIGAYTRLFPGEQLAMVLASVAARNTAARLWVADQQEDHDAVALLWDKGNNVFYLAGHELLQELHDDLACLIADEIRRQALTQGRPYFRARGLDPALDGAIPRLFAPVALRELVELFFGVRRRPNDVPPPKTPNVEVTPIDQALLEREDLANIEQVRDEIRCMWGTAARFYTHGFGFAAIVPGQVICWCTAEYVSDAQCGIGIATDPAYGRQGVASATAARFVQECLRRGISPFWECAAGNVPSARVAEKVGFERIETSRFWAGSFAG